MGRNIGNVVNSINELVAELGLEKLSGVGDPGTTQPAKVVPANSNIAPATEGARSAENTADNKSEVTGQSIAEAKVEDAKKDEAKSSASNITTATFVGEDPKVEKGFVTKVTDPGTTSAASATGSTKVSVDLGKCAEDVMAEIKKIGESTVKTAAEAREKMASMVEVKDGKKDEAVDQAVGEYITGYVKSAGLVGELTADMLDGMAASMTTKKAEGEGEGAPPAPEAGPGPEAGGAPEAGAAGGMDEEAAALAQAAAEIAAELGVSPEDVLDAAAAELEQGGGAAGGAPAGAPEGGMPPPPMEAAASAEKEAEIKVLREKAAELDALKAKMAADAAEQKQGEVVKTAVTNALEKFMADRKVESK